MDELLTVKEVSEILKTNPAFVYKLHNSGLLKFLKLGNLKCRRKSLDEFLATWDGYDVTDPWNPKKVEGINEHPATVEKAV